MTQHPQSTASYQGGLLAIALKHHLPIVVAFAAILCSLTSWYGFHRPVAYTSSASILLQPLKGNALSPSSDGSSQQLVTAMATEVALVNSLPVLKKVEDRLGIDVSTDSGQISATSQPNTRVVDVAFRAETAAQAQRGARAVAHSALGYRADRAQSYRDAKLANLRAQEKEIKQDMAKASKEANGRSATSEAAQEVQIYTTQLSSVRSNISEVLSAGSSPGVVIRSAELPQSPSTLSPWLFVAGGLIFGALLGIAAAVTRERLDRRVRIGDTSYANDGIAVMAATAAELPRHDAPHRGPIHEPFRIVRASILAEATSPSAISVSASTGFDDSVAVGAAIGQSLSRAGYTVTVVNANPQAKAASVLGLTTSHSLDDVLNGTGLDIALTSSGTLKVLDSGQTQKTTPDDLAGRDFSALVQTLKESNDYVIVITAPLSDTGGIAASLVSDYLILTATHRFTTTEDIATDLTHARTLGLDVLALTVINHGRRPRPGTHRKHSRHQPPRGAKATSPSKGDPSPGRPELPAGTTRE